MTRQAGRETNGGHRGRGSGAWYRSLPTSGRLGGRAAFPRERVQGDPSSYGPRKTVGDRSWSTPSVLALLEHHRTVELARSRGCHRHRTITDQERRGCSWASTVTVGIPARGFEARAAHRTDDGATGPPAHQSPPPRCPQFVARPARRTTHAHAITSRRVGAPRDPGPRAAARAAAGPTNPRSPPFPASTGTRWASGR